MLCTTTELEAPLLTLEGFQKEMAPFSLHTASEPNGVEVASQLRTCLPVGGNVALPAYFDRSVIGTRASESGQAPCCASQTRARDLERLMPPLQ
jgi:hypothetical protein